MAEEMGETSTKSSPDRGVLVSLFLFVLVDILGFSIVLPLMPYLASTYELSPTAVGLLQSSNALAQFIAVPFIGSLSDNYGRKPLLLICVLGTFISFIILAYAQNAFWVFFSRILDGLLGGNISLAQAYVADVTNEENRSKGMGMIGAAFGIGFIVGPAMGGILTKFDYSYPSLAAAALSLVNLITIYIFLPESLPLEKRRTAPKSISNSNSKSDSVSKTLVSDAPPSHNTRSKTVASQKLEVADFDHEISSTSISAVVKGIAIAVSSNKITLLRCRLIFFTRRASLIAFFVETSFGFFNRIVLGLSASHAAYALSFFGIMFAGIQGGGIKALSKRFSEGSIMDVSLLSLSVLYCIYAFSNSLYSELAVLAPLGLASGLVNTLVTTRVTKEVHSALMGSALGVSAALASLARIIAPPIGGYLIESVSPGAPFFLCGLVCLLLYFVGRGSTDSPSTEVK